MEGSISLDTLHRLLTSPAWVPQASLLPTDPKLITELHQALVENMSVFCPEPPPEISKDDSDEDEEWDESEDDEDAADPLLDDSKLASAVSETENGFLIRQLSEALPGPGPDLRRPPAVHRKITEKSAKN